MIFCEEINDQMEERRMENEFEGFVMPGARILPVFLLLDVSGTMSLDNKMYELNRAVKEMIETFKREQAVQVEIYVSIITFGDQAEMISVLRAVSEIAYSDLVAGGETCMGQAFAMAKEIIEDRNKLPPNSYRPVVVLVSDGWPQDRNDPGNKKFESQLDQFIATGRSAKCDRWSLAIGADADITMMKRFMNHPEKEVCYVEDAADIHKFFRFISSSTVQRSKSITPDVIPAELVSTDILDLNFD